jgi:hypothetical protein
MHYYRLERPVGDKHSSITVPFVRKVSVNTDSSAYYLNERLGAESNLRVEYCNGIQFGRLLGPYSKHFVVCILWMGIIS